METETRNVETNRIKRAALGRSSCVLHYVTTMNTDKSEKRRRDDGAARRRRMLLLCPASPRHPSTVQQCDFSFDLSFSFSFEVFFVSIIVFMVTSSHHSAHTSPSSSIKSVASAQQSELNPAQFTD